MDDQQQSNVNEAAEKFAEALTESFRAVSDRAVSAQQLNAELTQNFFNGVIDNLRTQAEHNRQLTEQLGDQQRRQQEAAQALAQESVGAYMDFMNSFFSYYQGNLQQAQQQMQRQVQQQMQQAGRSAGSSDWGVDDENRQAIRNVVEEANRRSGL